jgi:hypothetical protein
MDVLAAVALVEGAAAQNKSNSTWQDRMLLIDVISDKVVE